MVQLWCGIQRFPLAVDSKTLAWNYHSCQDCVTDPGGLECASFLPYLPTGLSVITLFFQLVSLSVGYPSFSLKIFLWLKAQVLSQSFVWSGHKQHPAPLLVIWASEKNLSFYSLPEAGVHFWLFPSYAIRIFDACILKQSRLKPELTESLCMGWVKQSEVVIWPTDYNKV
jgi:hypothetical protein